MYANDCKPIAITMGDAAGIGPELIVKLFQEKLPIPTVVYGDIASLKRAIHFTQLNHTKLHLCTQPQEALAHHQAQTIPIITAGISLSGQLRLGESSAEAGQASYVFLNAAIDAALSDRVGAIVTAPVHKVSLQKAGVNFPGHTEILAHRAGVEHVGMMLLNHELRVILVTIHMAYADVPKYISPEKEAMAIRLAQRACFQLGLPQARIAVAGLNPHAGEEGRFGKEDEEVIRPTILALQKEGIHVTGPYPGDTVFMRARKGEFDIVVAQYHDQGLIPIKYLGVDTGVNVTVGLPFIRTSVDHGTAFDIAGKGVADPSSLKEAYRLALKMRSKKPHV